MFRHVLIAGLICLSLSCASGGSTADETSDPTATPDRHYVKYSVSGGRYQVSYVSEVGPREEVVQAGQFIYGYWAESGDTARVTVRRLGEYVAKRITVRLWVDSKRTQHFIETAEFEPFTLEVPIP